MIKNKQKYLSFQEFFKIYPDIVHRNENMDEIHKFYELFKKPIIKEEKPNNDISLSKSYKKFNSDSASLIKTMREKIKNVNKSISISNQNSKKSSTDSYQNEHNEIEDEKKEDFDYDYYLIKKGIYLQNKKKKRSDDIKKALEIFLFNSSIIEKLTNNLSIIESSIKKSKKLISGRKSEANSTDDDLKYKIKAKLNTIVAKLSERVLIKKYAKNKLVIKMNEIGEDCYFLLSGKVSILKPVEYKGIKITYKQYFIYLKSLLDLNEIDLLSQILIINKKFLDVVNIDESIRLIRVYFASSLKLELSRKINGITLPEVEAFFKEFNYKFEDFKINKEKMMKEIMANKEIGSNVDIMLRNYIYDNIHMSTEDLFLLDLHNVFNIEKEKKAPLVSLFRYEIFLYLYPGSFFGDAALEAKIKKRNASIRTEEDCIICSLSNEYYNSLIAEENKKLRIIDLQFLLNNFFFHEISPNIFNRYYFPMFKLSERKKKDVIFKSNEKLSSVFLLKDGIIKTEIKTNVKDLINLIKKIIKALYLKSNNLKITLEQIMELKKTYLKDDLVLESMENKDYILSDKIIKKIYNLYYSDGFECLGIIEYCLDLNFLTTCTVVSDKAIFMEIKKEDLSRIIQNDKEILPSYFNFVHMNALSLTRRLYFLKNNLLNKLVSNLNERKKGRTLSEEINFSNNHKQKIEIINSDKARTLYKQKYPKFKDKSYKYSIKRINISTKKNLSSVNEKTIKKRDSSLLTRDNYDLTRTFLAKRREPNIISKYSMKMDESEKNKEKKDSVVNIRNKILSINLIKKRIVKEFFKKKNLQKLNIVLNLYKDKEDEKSFFEEIFNNKYFEEKNKSLEEENSPNNKTKETISNQIKSIKENSFNTFRKDRSSISLFPDIKKSDKKIRNLIKEMKQKHSINLGQRKFIIYRKSKVNKVYNDLIKEKDNESIRQKSAKNIIKNYYFKKKIEGYSSIVNPLNNTYINRQKTVKFKKNVDLHFSENISKI